MVVESRDRVGDRSGCAGYVGFSIAIQLFLHGEMYGLLGFFSIERSLVSGCVCQVLCHEVVGRGKGGVSDFGEKQRLFSSKVYCVMVREIDVPWDPEKGA